MTNKYDVKRLPEGLSRVGKQSICRFLENPNPTYQDYVVLRSGGLDVFSRKGIPELEKIVPAKDCIIIRQELKDDNDYIYALRWAARGLTAKDAACKANVDHKVREEAI